MAYAETHRAPYGWWARLRCWYWLACGLWVEPRVRSVARSLALY
jgi:hypothetical protein